MANIGFLYRMYTQSKGAFYNGDSTTLPKTIDPRYAEDRRKKNEDLFETITLYLPAKEVLEVEIPIGEANDKTKEDEDFEKSILSDIRIDPKTRIICNKILIDYMYTSGGYFVKRKGNERSKMHTKNMEVLQLMKDVIMGFIRYDPIKLDYEVGKGARRKRIEHDWDIAEDLIDKTYYVGKKKYTTSIYGVYTRILRKSMFKNSVELYNFYGNHEFQYFQRQYDLNYGAINYICASRDSGKTIYTLYNTCLPMFKSLTFKKEFGDKATLKTHFYVTSQAVIENYSIKLKEFFRNLLVDTYKLSDEAANQIVRWNKASYTMTLCTADDDRPLEFVSEGALSKRGERSARVTLDEANYLRDYEKISGDIIGYGAGTINQISTISVGSKQSPFYKSRVEAMVKQRSSQSIEEVIHHVWTKYGFDKMKSREDYKQMIKDGIFDLARTEYYKLRNTYAMKVTLDEVEYLTEEEKELKIQTAINTGGYEAMLAEYYCELSPEKAAINYKPNIIDIENVPSRFQKIYAGYDEADTGDQATLVVGGVNDRKLYILEGYVLPKELGNRYKRMKEILDERANKSILKPSLIVDIGRGPMYFMDTNRNVPYADMGIQARFGRFEKIESTQGVSYYSLGTQLLVEDIMNTQLIGTDKLFFSSGISPTLEIKYPDGIKEVEGLFGQLDNYVLEGKSYKGRGKKPDDLVSALLYVSYYAYVDAIKEGAILESRQVSDPIEVLDAKFESKRREMQELVKRPKKSVWSIW